MGNTRLLKQLGSQCLLIYKVVAGDGDFLKSDFLLANEFCIIGTVVVAPKTSTDVITTTIMIPLIVWFIFFNQ
jgi:hypothetical protein